MDPLTIGLFAVFALLIVVMFRNSRKRQRATEELRAQIVPGADVMTQGGLFGTLISVDEDSNEAIIETTPGTLLRVHRMTISQVTTPTDPSETEAAGDSELDEIEAETLSEVESDGASNDSDRNTKPTE